MESSAFNSLIGRRLGEIRLVEPISWWFEFVGGGAIRADAFWRLVHGGRIQTTSEDHGQVFGLPQPVDSASRARDVISASPVRDVAVAPATGDLFVDFENGSRLEVLTTSSGYESWSVVLPSGDEVIGLGGGDLHLRKQSD
jgi:hypothetical protein